MCKQTKKSTQSKCLSVTHDVKFTNEMPGICFRSPSTQSAQQRSFAERLYFVIENILNSLLSSFPHKSINIIFFDDLFFLNKIECCHLKENENGWAKCVRVYRY